MKKEYLSRAATINRESLAELIKDAALEVAGRPDVDAFAVPRVGIAANILSSGLDKELFTDSGDAVTLLGEDFAVKEMTMLRSKRGLCEEVVADGDDAPDIDLVFNLLGCLVVLLLAVEDKLFSSDHVEEHEAVKAGKEETHD